ncbi:hypothetical protein [Archangium gephyra]|uniref:hypothetical protein n=2 Tax=Archangium gephyra TaxID=48 RepID=UPI0012E126B0|nr:hypothetical protein [Archangium gephyra]
MNQYSKKNYSRSKWKKHPPIIVHWFEDKHGPNGNIIGSIPKNSSPFTVDTIEQLLASSGTFDFAKLGLYDPRCNWLDASVDFAPHFHVIDSNSGKALTIVAKAPYGDKLPYDPTLDREGRGFTSFQGIILRRITTLRTRLVETSDASLGDEWFQSFRALVSECVSLIDTTLHQLYFKAKLDPLAGWKFDEKALGPRHGRRLTDKFNWVYKITGKFLHADTEKKNFVAIKDLRNHLQHFDPPSFCYTLEDAATWLNQVIDCGRLNWAIRQCAGSPLSVPLIELLLQRAVQFVPEHPAAMRVPQPDNVGYLSTKPQAVEGGDV